MADYVYVREMNYYQREGNAVFPQIRGKQHFLHVGNNSFLVSVFPVLNVSSACHRPLYVLFPRFYHTLSINDKMVHVGIFKA